jgi:hypothetical protein
MVQVVQKKESIAGRLGKGLGQGLSETVPKEIERSRLSTGLKKFAENSSNLSPQQQIAEIAGLPGVTPQLIETMGQLARQQSIRNNLEASRGGRTNTKTPTPSPEQDFRNIEFAGGIQRPEQQSNQNIQEQTRNVSPREKGQPQINPKNPLREEAQPGIPPSSEQVYDRALDILAIDPQLGLQGAWDQAIKEFNIDLARPEAERKRDEALRETQERIEGKFKEALETKLHKKFKPGSGEESIYSQLPGEYYTDLVRGLEKDLRENKKSSEKDVIDDWSTRGLDLTKTKSQLEKYAKSDFGLKNLINKKAGKDKLDQYSNIYKKAGNSEQYFNYLKSDMGFSPQGAASVAFPLSKDLNKTVDRINKKSASLIDESNFIGGGSYGFGYHDLINDISKNIKDDDSLLSLSFKLKEKDPFFNQQEFFEEMNTRQDELRFNARQRREIAEGVSDWFTNWSDFLAL